MRIILTVLFCLSVSLKGANDGRWIDPADPTIPVDFKYQGEYVGSLENGGKSGCQVVALGSGIFQAVIYTGGLPGAGWDGKSRSLMDGKLIGKEVIFTPAICAVQGL
jgi:hypothetical protein